MLCHTLPPYDRIIIPEESKQNGSRLGYILRFCEDWWEFSGVRRGMSTVQTPISIETKCAESSTNYWHSSTAVCLIRLDHEALKLQRTKNTQHYANPPLVPMTSWVSHAKSNIGQAAGSRLSNNDQHLYEFSNIVNWVPADEPTAVMRSALSGACIIPHHNVWRHGHCPGLRGL